jgi:signal peptidase I
MLLALLVLTLLALLVLNLFVGGGLLWLACRVCQIKGATYRRALLTVLVTAGVGLLLDLAILSVTGFSFWATPFLLLRAIAIPLITVRVFLAPTFGKTLLAWLLWTVFGLVYAVPVTLVVWAGFAEALVVPTGAMAETIRGYHKNVTCPQCGHTFAVNASVEVEPYPGQPPTPVVGCTCPNCRWHIDLTRQARAGEVEGGDRILVTKGLLGPAFVPLERYQPVVFLFPETEGKPGPPIRYVKRVIGLPGEKVGIHYGDLYVLQGVEPTPEDLQAPANDRWKPQHMHPDDQRPLLEAHDHVPAGEPRFTILRKPLDLVLDLRQLVYDNDHPAQDLERSPRWADAAGAWTADQARGFRHAPRPEGGPAWLRYRHLLRMSGSSAEVGAPHLVTDFTGYNTWEPAGGGHPIPGGNWVGDLILECEVTVDQPSGALVLELSEGVDRFRARFDLASGLCTLSRQTLGEEEKPLGDGRPTALKQAGTYQLRFANVDDRLTVWVNGGLPFGDGVEYPAPARRGPTRQNDLEPAGIGVDGAAVSVHKLKLWRDTYYTLDPGRPDFPLLDVAKSEAFLDAGWASLAGLPGRTLYVQPGHYLCLGDNSPESSDSRSWGLVPERLMVGRALLGYYPPPRMRLLR